MPCGPFYSYGSPADLERLLDAIRSSGVEVSAKSPKSDLIRFRRGFGLVTCRLCGTATRPAMYLACGHPFNPLLWRADARLLVDIERVLQANGSRMTDLYKRGGPSGEKFEIRVDQSAISVHRRGTDEVQWRFEWQAVEEILVWKDDLFTVDRISMGLVLTGSDALKEVDEEMLGWREFTKTIERRLGVAEADWWGAVAFPAFATNQRTIWQRR